MYDSVYKMQWHRWFTWLVLTGTPVKCCYCCERMMLYLYYYYHHNYV